MRHWSTRFGIRAIAVSALLGSAVVFGAAAPAAAATIIVTSGADDGGGADTTLREAIATAVNGDTIEFDPSVTTVTLSSQIDIGKNLTIGDATATARVVVQPDDMFEDVSLFEIGGNSSPTFAGVELSGLEDLLHVVFATVDTVALTLDNVRITEGRSNNIRFDRPDGTLTITDSLVDRGRGSGIQVNGAALVTITDTVARDNLSVGLAINATGVSTVANSEFSDNGNGVLHASSGDLTISNTLVEGNDTNGLSSSTTGSLTVQRSTIRENNTGLFLVRKEADTTVTESTFAANTSYGIRDFIVNDDTTTVTVENSTLTGTSSSQAPLQAEANVAVRHSTIAANTGAQAISSDGDVVVDHSIVMGTPVGSGVVTVSNSLVTTASGLGGTNGNITADDPMLSPLADFGGPTETMRPLAGSPALDAGDPAISGEPATDQRGGARTAGTIDIGSVEVDAGTVAIVAAVEAAEDDGTATVTLTRAGGTDGVASAQVTSTDGTATAGDDYTAVDETVTWADGDAADKTVVVTLVDDATPEDTETFTLDVTGATVDPAAAATTVTITDSDPVLVPGELSVQDATADEADGTVTISIDRADGDDGPATVTVTSADDTAIAGDDYTAIDETISWADGESGAQTVTVTLLDDDVVEDSETFDVELSDATGATIASDASSATVTINDDDVADPDDPDPDPDSASSPLPIARLVDTRASGDTVDDLFQAEGKRAAQTEYRVTIAGRAGVPDDATAAVVNVTAVAPEDTGFLTVHPCADPRPLASSLNYASGVNIANEIVAPLSDDGELCVYTSSVAHVLVDVVGYVGATSTTTSLTPARYLDTRSNGETFDGDGQQGGRAAVDSTTTISIGGRGDVPSDAASVIVNLTAVNASADGFLTAFACDPDVPNASSVNFTAGVNRANEVIVSLSDGGDICVFSSADVDLVADVVGYLSTGSDYTAIEPARFVDTRDIGETVDGEVQAGGVRDADTQLVVQIAGRPGVPDGATAVVVNVAAVAATGDGFLTVHGCLDPRPNASSLNYVQGVNVANELIVPLSPDGTICIYTSSGTHLLADVVGHFGPTDAT